jgi:hypothetical protein
VDNTAVYHLNFAIDALKNINKALFSDRVASIKKLRQSRFNGDIAGTISGEQ